MYKKKKFTTSLITIVLSILSCSLVSDKDFSKFHVLIDITENIRKILDDGDIYCKVVVDLQQTFDTVDCQLLFAKLNHYVICGVSNDWIKSYRSGCNQYVSISRYVSSLAETTMKRPSHKTTLIKQ